jgi:hypothetical protein
MNTLNALFDFYDWATNMGGAEVLKWNGEGFDQAVNIGGYQQPPFWDPYPQAGDITMLPGTPVFMVNPISDPYAISFTGLVREQQVVQIQPGTNYLSATVPQAGALTNITGYVPNAGDTVELWDTTNQLFVSYTFVSGAWSNGVPRLGVGEGFVLISTNAHTWTNTWQTMAPQSP